ncbi:hypothetical protein OH76DRAFT_1482432 [Lentinus brumalis]|uniref:F-box domain-containing protein n=1 Tax=Lentinus brumalis TaxID=2498619 RepID=A0A371DCK4_9APHY|nr:hypothetical protein OH76DRAFT_1482432 [Polyporus brumalis]
MVTGTASSTTVVPIPPEVAHAICMNTVSLNTLACLARTSQLFHRYSRQKLWHTLPSFVPIIRTMPPDAYRLECNAKPSDPCISARELPAATLKATRHLTSEDLARFLLYAPFVRRIVPRYKDWWSWKSWAPLSADRYRDDDVSPELWEMLLSIWPSHLLDLEVLEYKQVAYIDWKAYAHPLHLFVGPSLQTLDFTVLYLRDLDGHPDDRIKDFTTQDPKLEVLFRLLPQLAPHLRTFAFDSGWGVIARDALSAALCGFSQLTSVKVNRTALHMQAVYHLSTLPALRDLELRLPPREEVVSEVWPSRTPGTFAALRKVVLHAQQLDECIDLLEHVTSPALHAIATHVDKSSSTATFEALTSVISTLPSSTMSLRSLTFVFRRTDWLATEALNLLLPLSALEELVLSGGVYAIVNDATLCAMAQSWPKIRLLTLFQWMDDETPRHTIQATVHGLRYFAQYCPDLKRLDVPLSDISAETLALPAACTTYPQLDTWRPHVLEELHVGKPRLHNEAALAAYLSSLFPALGLIEHCWDDSFPADVTSWTEEDWIQDRWCALQEVYDAFVTIRAQERSWHAERIQSLIDV